MKRREPKPITLTEAQFLPRAYALWTSTHPSHGYSFFAAYVSEDDARKASERLSYLYTTRITPEGYEQHARRHTKPRRSR